MTPLLVEGPWEHRYVVANGARFHLAAVGSGPLVLFLHGYPQFWWTWRHQIQAVAGAGFRAAAMDVRGFGASDKPPAGYALWNLAADVASVVRSMGEAHAVVVGHGGGAMLAWSMPHLHPHQTRAVAVVSNPHPALVWRLRLGSLRGIHIALRSGAMTRAALTRMTEYRTGDDPAHVTSLLRRWAAPGSNWPSEEEASRYRAAMALPFAPRTAGEAHRWLVQAPFHPAGRRLRARICGPVDVPVLQLHGSADPLYSPESARRSAQFVTAAYTAHEIGGAGHFPQEESPATVSEHLVDWLRTLRSLD